MKYILLSILCIPMLSGCVQQPQTLSIAEEHQGTWTAAEETTAFAAEQVSLTIGRDQLTFTSVDLTSDTNTHVAMDYIVTDISDEVYHLSLSNPVGRVINVPKFEGDTPPETLDPQAIANTLWQQYQDMYINASDSYVLRIYAAGYENNAIDLFRK